MNQDVLNSFNKELEKLGFLGFGGGTPSSGGGSGRGPLSFISDPIKKQMSPGMKSTFGAVKKGLGSIVAPAFVLWEAASARKNILGGSGLVEGMPSAKNLSRMIRR